MERRYVEGTWQKKRAFSPAWTTQGGRMVWVAGHGAPHDANVKSLAGDFDAVQSAFIGAETKRKSALAFAPVFVANLVFTHSFRETQTADMAFASNLLGAMVGGTPGYGSVGCSGEQRF